MGVDSGVGGGSDDCGSTWESLASGDLLGAFLE